MSTKIMREEIIDKRIGVVGIHVALLSVLIGIIVAVSVYYSARIDEAEILLINEAEKINDIYFSRTPYFPKDTKDRGEQNAIKSLNAARQQYVPNIKVSKVISHNLKKPKSVEEIMELFRYLDFLSGPPLLEEVNKDIDIGSGKFIPKDMARRGEEILIVIDLLVHSTLFPEPIYDTVKAYKKGHTRKIQFDEVRAIGQWLEKLNVFNDEVKGLKYFQSFFQKNIFLAELSKRDKALIEAWESSQILPAFGNINPESIWEEFMLKSKEVAKVSASTQYQLDKYNNLVQKLPRRDIIILLFFLLGLVFVCSVIFPLFIVNCHRSLYIHFPFLVYLLSYIYISYKITYLITK